MERKVIQSADMIITASGPRSAGPGAGAGAGAELIAAVSVACQQEASG